MRWKKYSGIANMHTKVFTAVLLSVATVGIVGCASSSAPRGWLPSPKESKVDQFGSWIEIRLEGVEHPIRIDGEFIAVSRDSVFIADESGLHVVALEQIQKARVTSYDSNYGSLAGWTTVGSLTTISHGVLLIGTLPLWLIAGTMSTAARSREGMTWADGDWHSIRKYARYPTGLPDGLDRSKIKAKQAAKD